MPVGVLGVVRMAVQPDYRTGTRLLPGEVAGTSFIKGEELQEQPSRFELLGSDVGGNTIRPSAGYQTDRLRIRIFLVNGR